MSRAIRNNILVGLFLTVPIVVTILIFKFVFDLATDWLPDTWFSTIRALFHDKIAGKYAVQILTLILIMAFFFLVGLFVRNFFGRQLYNFGDKFLTRIPFIKNIYVSVRQISESLFTQRKTLFKEVVLVEYPRKGLYSLAFVTASAPSSVCAVINNRFRKEECVSLFISTTPNPTSGVFILVPKSEIMPLNMPVADALTFIMSAGAVAPGEKGDNIPTLLDKLEAWLKHESTATTEDGNAETATT